MRNIVVLTGAGISQESGLDTFRDKEGLWSRVRIEDVATPEAYSRDPARVLGFYNMRRRLHGGGTIAPNAGHGALARLEREWTKGAVLIVTQNIDNLHEKAGSENLIHMHGEIMKARCCACGEIARWEVDITLEDACGRCRAKGRMRPHVVWFGEMPFAMDRIAEALRDCDLFLSIGTSGAVYPAAGFVREVRRAGRAHTVELNLEPSEGASLFAETIYGRATEVLPVFVNRLLAEQN